jgi:hypothetical protein
LACLKKGHLTKNNTSAFTLAGKLLQAVFLCFFINKLAKARLLSLFDCFALYSA